MKDTTDEPSVLTNLDDVGLGLSGAEAALTVAVKSGVPIRDAKEISGHLRYANGALKAGTTIAATGTGLAAASSLSVAATSGAGIASGLAGAGSVVGGGMAAGPMAISAGPTFFGVRIINHVFFREASGHSKREASARRAARFGTGVGGVVGFGGAGALVVAGGASGPAIMGTLATVGGLIGGGALAGIFLVAAAPIAVAGLGGYALYRCFRGGKASDVDRVSEIVRSPHRIIVRSPDRIMRKLKPHNKSLNQTGSENLLGLYKQRKITAKFDRNLAWGATAPNAFIWCIRGLSNLLLRLSGIASLILVFSVGFMWAFAFIVTALLFVGLIWVVTTSAVKSSALGKPLLLDDLIQNGVMWFVYKRYPKS